MHLFKNRINALILLALFFAPPSFAERADRSQAITIEANQADINPENNQMSYHGNVVMTQGTLQLKAQSVQAMQLEGGRQILKAQGAPASFRQRMDPTPERGAEWIEGQAKQLEYDSNKAQIKLIGDARIKRGKDVAHGQTIFYEGDSGQFRISGSSKGRISITLQPRQ